MKTVSIYGKKFKLYMSDAEIESTVQRLAHTISADFTGMNPILCPVLTGSYMFAADLSRQLTIDHEVSFVKFSSYQGMKSTGSVKPILDYPRSCQGRSVIIVEDIVDTGLTMDFMLRRLKELEPASISICSFFFKPTSFKYNFNIDYIGRSIPDDFVVGYGLDYDEFGRHLPDIYILDEQ